MIIGTAGHIDHGKTTLVRALTGIDTDRLKEEKARGISIELGYAYAAVPAEDGSAAGDEPAQMLGIIDVPGHEKFVHTMAAGASGIDHVLLVVAADDGVMPQTREHLAIVELFGISQGTVALTKCDRADAARIAAVRADIAALLAGTPLAGASVFETGIPPHSAGEKQDQGPCVAAVNAGIDALRHHLFAQARHQHARRRDDLFRLAVDRVFTLAGHGTVVTGTVFGGQVLVGHTLAHFGAGSGDGNAPPRVVRVRSLHAQNRAAEQGGAGQRVALNLAGVDKHDIARGDWIADARLLQPTRRVDVRVRLLDGEPPLVAWTPLHVHLGAAHRQAHAVPLDDGIPADFEAGRGVRPGRPHAQSIGARAQLVFDTPVFVVPGDRLILRNAQGTRTVGGGVVLDPMAPERRRRSAERMQWLDAMETLVAQGDARPLLAVAPAGLTRSALARLLGRLPTLDWAGPGTPTFVLGQPGPQAGAALAAPGAGGTADVLWLSPAAWAQVRRRMLDALERHHVHAPDEPGLNSARLLRLAFPAQVGAAGGLPGGAVWLDQLVVEGAIARAGQWLHLPAHRIVLNEAEQALSQRLLPLLRAGGNDPPWVRDLAQAAGAREDAVRNLLRKQARLGVIYQVVKDLFYPAERMVELAEIFARLSQAELDAGVAPKGLPVGAVQARAFRDAVQLGRKRAIQILEFFDRIGYTRRVGDAHLLRPHSRWSVEGPASVEGAAP